MANRFLCGFDDYAAADMAKEWTSVSVTPTFTTGRTGNCFRASTWNCTARITCIPEGQQTVTVGCAWRTSAIVKHILFQLCGAALIHLKVIMNADGTLSVLNDATGTAWNWNDAQGTVLGTGTHVFLVNTWYYIELQATIAEAAAGGAFELRVNGNPTPDISGTDVDTRNADVAAVKGIMIGGDAATNPDIDDLYVNDNTGGVNDDFEGDCRVDSHLPVTPNGTHSEWTRSAGADQWATIDDNPPNSGGSDDYNSTTVLNELDTLNVDDFKNAGATLKAVQVMVLASKSGEGDCGVAPVITQDGDDHVGTQVNPSTTAAYFRQNYDQDTESAAWAEATFNANEFGYKKVA